MVVICVLTVSTAPGAASPTLNCSAPSLRLSSATPTWKVTSAVLPAANDNGPLTAVKSLSSVPAWATFHDAAVAAAKTPLSASKETVQVPIAAAPSASLRFAGPRTLSRSGSLAAMVAVALRPAASVVGVTTPLRTDGDAASSATVMVSASSVVTSLISAMTTLAAVSPAATVAAAGDGTV